MRGAGSCRMRGGTGACGAGGCGPLRAESGPLLLRQGLLNGKIDLSVFRGQDQDLDGLPLLQKIMYVVDKGVGDLRNVYQTGPAALQGDERAEFGDRSHLAFQNTPNLRLHMVICFSFQRFSACLPKAPFLKEKTGAGSSGGSAVPPSSPDTDQLLTS